MDASFWLDRWQNNKTGWHEKQANPLLINNVDHLKLSKGDRIFLPLCGKSLDIAWLLDQGYQVVGVELSELAVKAVFESLEITPKISNIDDFIQYETDDLILFVGDFFLATADLIGYIDATYDRAALVALPENMRTLYAEHLMLITKKAPQLLITLEYDQNFTAGPPFSINTPMLIDYYHQYYEASLLEDVHCNVKGDRLGEHNEKVWHLKSCTQNNKYNKVLI